jgi:hypothetical protein
MQDAHELVVVDVSQSSPKMHFAQESKMGEQLPQADIGGKRPHFSK